MKKYIALLIITAITPLINFSNSSDTLGIIAKTENNCPLKNSEIKVLASTKHNASSFLFPQDTVKYLPKKAKAIKITGLDEQINAAVSASEPYWQAAGPGCFNVPMDVVVRGKKIFIQTDWGLYVSDDTGEHWRVISHTSYGGIDAYMYGFDVSPIDNNFIVVAGTQISRSYDNGKKWIEAVRSYPDRYAVFRQPRFNCDGSKIFIGMGRYSYCYGSSGTKSSIGEFSEKILFIGDSKAAHFNAHILNNNPSEISTIYAHPSNPNIMFFSYKDGEMFTTLNASAEQPEFFQIKVPENYSVTGMAIDPRIPDRLLATLNFSKKRGEKQNDSYPYSMLCSFKGILGRNVACELLPLKTESGAIINEHNLVSLAINPTNPQNIIIGIDMTLTLLISTNGAKTFKYFTMPREKYGNNWFMCAVREARFGTSSNTCVINSPVCAWISNDGLQNLIPLCPVDGKWFGNKGVSGLAHIQDIILTENFAYFSAQDHGAWRSARKDLSKWELLTPNNGITDKGFLDITKSFPRVQGIHASNDDKYIYLVRQERNINPKRIIMMHDEQSPGNWKNINDKFDADNIIRSQKFNPHNPVKVLFHPVYPQEHWIIITDSLYHTTDGGKTFKKNDGKPMLSNVPISALAYDHWKNILYLGYQIGAGSEFRNLSEFGLSPLYRSFDKGLSWETFDIGVNNIRSIAIAANGTLVVGTALSKELPGQLIVLPDGNPALKEIKCTIGDIPEELNMSQLCFDNIKTDGNNILVIANYYHLYRNRIARNAALGPLLSTDGGKTFKWIRYDLPCTWILSASLKNDIVAIGDSAGMFYINLTEKGLIK